jgi:putative transposase
MSKFRKSSHAIHYCRYHIVWCPKYQYRVLTGKIAEYVEKNIKMICDWKNVLVIELNILPDHIHVIFDIPPKYSISYIMGIIKGKIAIGIFKNFRGLREKTYLGNHFWSRGFCVSTIGLDEEKIRKYVKYQEENDKNEEEGQQEFKF